MTRFRVEFTNVFQKMMKILLCMQMIAVTFMVHGHAETDVTAYSYEVMPVLAPFNRCIFVKTENPDPFSFRLADPESAWKNTWKTEPCVYEVDQTLYADVVYQDESRFRTENGYLFVCRDEDADGGTLVLQKKTAERKYENTGVKVACPKLETPVSYLAELSGGKDVFDALNQVVEYLKENAVRPFAVLNPENPGRYPYPYYSASYPDGYELKKWFRMYEEEDLLLVRSYPFSLDPYDFASMIWMTGYALDPDVEIEDLGKGTYQITKGGKSLTIDSNVIEESHNVFLSTIHHTYRFDNGLFDLHQAYDLLKEYAGKEDLSDYEGQLQLPEENGWIRINRDFIGDRLDASYDYAYSCQGNIVYDAWVDGRYVDPYGIWRHGCIFRENDQKDIIKDNRYFRYADDVWMDEAGNRVDRKQIMELEPDVNTYLTPDSGFRYDGLAEGGTPFENDHVTSLLIPETVYAQPGMTFDLMYAVRPDNAADKTLSFASSDQAVAGINAAGGITAGNSGEAIVTVYVNDGRIPYECHVVVNDSIPADICMLAGVLHAGDAFNWTVSSSKQAELQSSDPAVITFGNDGTVKALAAGTAEITVSVEGKQYHQNVVVTDRNTRLLAENGTLITLYQGDKRQLQLGGGTGRISFTTDQPDVLMVGEEGMLEGLQAGTAYVFARDEQGNYDAVTVQVVTDDPAACRVFGFCRWNQGEYWFENGKRQGLYGDPRNITDRLFNIERGREIYDPESDGWYWLDADSVGKKATSKEVWIPYIYQNEKPGSTEGKWVRYDQNGKMIKGWLKVEDYTAFEYPDQIHNVYYYDEITGAMLKGRQTIDGIEYEFDELTGVLKDRMGEQ